MLWNIFNKKVNPESQAEQHDEVFDLKKKTSVRTESLKTQTINRNYNQNQHSRVNLAPSPANHSTKDKSVGISVIILKANYDVYVLQWGFKKWCSKFHETIDKSLEPTTSVWSTKFQNDMSLKERRVVTVLSTNGYTNMDDCKDSLATKEYLINEEIVTICVRRTAMILFNAKSQSSSRDDWLTRFDVVLRIWSSTTKYLQ